MKIGLIDVDGHGKKKLWGATVYPNLALCKIAAWHKLQGDDVGWYDPMFGGHYDTVYCAKVFNFSPDYPYRINADTTTHSCQNISTTHSPICQFTPMFLEALLMAFSLAAVLINASGV